MKNALLSLLICSFCFLSHQTRAATAAATPADAAVQAAKDEIIRRQEAQITARKLIDQGEKLSANGRHEEAIAKFEQALKVLPKAKATDADRTRAERGITNARAGMAKAAPRTAPAAVAAAPAGESNPAATPEFLAKRDQIKKLFREGKIMLNSGQLDEAERRFQQVLLIDPYNEDAHVLIGQVNSQRYSIAQTGADETRARRLWEVTDAWIPPLGREVQVPKPGEGAGPIGAVAARQAEMTKKLNSIVIPDINFRDAVITDVLRFLSDESRRLDPEKIGVNIVLQLGEPGAAPAPTPGPEGTPAPAPEMTGDPSTRKVTLALRNIPLVEALRYVTSIAGLKFRVEPSAILVLPKEAPEGEMITRTYPVESGAVREVLSAPTTSQTERTSTSEFEALKGTAGTVTRQDLRQFFIDAGVPFPAGSSLAYNERTSTIIVRNTVENIDVFERVLSALNVVPKQVEIEAKFVEVSQQDLDELGFRWDVGEVAFGTSPAPSFTFEGGSDSGIFAPGRGYDLLGSDNVTAGLRDSTTIQANALDTLLAASGFGAVSAADSQIGTIHGILNELTFALTIKALSQKKSADILFAPKVTTISGNTAQMKVVREFIYPTEYSLPQVAQNSVTPSIPQSFKTREIGVLLNCTPTVGADGYTINLTVVPEVSDFEGFLDYSPGSSFSGSATGGVIIVENIVKQPLFNSRNLSTSIVIWDGQTVVLGGLIREDMQKLDDKVPVLGDIPMLGRLFRSKTTIRTKRNLLVFVTARLVDPSGNLIHRPSATLAATK